MASASRLVSKHDDDWEEEEVDEGRFYAKDPKDNEIYSKDGLGNDAVMNRADGEPFYPTDAKGATTYPKNALGEETYSYFRGKPILAHDADGRDRYARDGAKNEFYPVDPVAGGQIALNGRYAEKVNGARFYPRRSDRKEFLLLDEYARDEAGKPFYPTDAHGVQYLRIGEERYIFENDSAVYPKDSKGDPVYERNGRTGDEEYVVRFGRAHFGRDRAGDEVYAKRANRDEFYPPGDPFTYAKRRDDTPRYAKAKSGETIFPLDGEGDERYIRVGKVDYIRFVERYARTKEGLELYPAGKIGGHEFDKMIGDRYAKDADGQPYYPLDSYENEYTLEWNEKRTEAECLPHAYPVTNTDRVILPDRDDRPLIAAHLKEKIGLEHVVGRLKRRLPNRQREDHLTELKSSRKTRARHFYKFRYQDLRGQERTVARAPKSYARKGGIARSVWTILAALFAVVVGCLLYAFHRRT